MYTLRSALPKKMFLGRPFLNQRVKPWNHFTTTIAGQIRDPMYFQKGVSRLHKFKWFLSCNITVLFSTLQPKLQLTVMMEEVWNTTLDGWNLGKYRNHCTFIHHVEWCRNLSSNSNLSMMPYFWYFLSQKVVSFDDVVKQLVSRICQNNFGTMVDQGLKTLDLCPNLKVKIMHSKRPFSTTIFHLPIAPKNSNWSLGNPRGRGLPPHPAGPQPATRFQRVEQLQPRKKEGRARLQCLWQKPGNLWIFFFSGEVEITLQGMDTYPTKRKRRIIDSKCHFWGDMLVFRRVGRKKCWFSLLFKTSIEVNYKSPKWKCSNSKWSSAGIPIFQARSNQQSPPKKIEYRLGSDDSLSNSPRSFPALVWLTGFRWVSGGQGLYSKSPRRKRRRKQQ